MSRQSKDSLSFLQVRPQAQNVLRGKLHYRLVRLAVDHVDDHPARRTVDAESEFTVLTKHVGLVETAEGLCDALPFGCLRLRAVKVGRRRNRAATRNVHGSPTVVPGTAMFSYRTFGSEVEGILDGGASP